MKSSISKKLHPLSASIILATAQPAMAGITTEYIQATDYIGNTTDIAYFVAPTSISNDNNLVAYTRGDQIPAGEPNYGIYDRTTGESATPVTGIDGAAVRMDHPVISGNGKVIVFASRTDNVVDNDPEGLDVFAHNIETGETERLSTIGNAAIRTISGYGRLSVSDDGRFVTFSANTDVNGEGKDTFSFLRDRTTDTTQLIGEGQTIISGDGSTLLTLSADSNGNHRVLTMQDRASLAVLEELRPQEIGSGEDILNFSISADASTIGFDSINRIFVYNRTIGLTKEVQLKNAAGQPYLSLGQLSENGRFLSFQNIQYSFNGPLLHNAYVYDFWSNKVTQLSENTESRGDNYYHLAVPKIYSQPIPISADGSVIATDFLASLSNEDTNNNEDIYIFAIQPPGSIQNARVLTAGESQLTVTWEELPETSIPTSYQAEIVDKSTYTWTSTTYTLNNQVTFQGLEPGTEQLVRVRAYNSWGESDYSYIYTILPESNQED